MNITEGKKPIFYVNSKGNRTILYMNDHGVVPMLCQRRDGRREAKTARILLVASLD